MRCWFLVEIVHVGDGIEKAFGSQEISGSRSSIEGQPQRPDQWINRVIAFGAVVPEIPISTLTSKAVMRCNCFEQSGLSCAILSSKQADS
jgi:hypothetical protein